MHLEWLSRAVSTILVEQDQPIALHLNCRLGAQRPAQTCHVEGLALAAVALDSMGVSTLAQNKGEAQWYIEGQFQSLYIGPTKAIEAHGCRSVFYCIRTVVGLLV